MHRFRYGSEYLISPRLNDYFYQLRSIIQSSLLLFTTEAQCVSLCRTCSVRVLLRLVSSQAGSLQQRPSSKERLRGNILVFICISHSCATTLSYQRRPAEEVISCLRDPYRLVILSNSLWWKTAHVIGSECSQQQPSCDGKLPNFLFSNFTNFRLTLP